MSQNLSSAGVVIGALMVNAFKSKGFSYPLSSGRVPFQYKNILSDISRFYSYSNRTFNKQLVRILI